LYDLISPSRLLALPPSHLLTLSPIPPSHSLALIQQLLLLRFSEYVADSTPTLLAIAQHLDILTPARQYKLEQAKGAIDANQASVHEKSAPKGYNSTMSEGVRAQLEAFYAPWNEKLRDFIRSVDVKQAKYTIRKSDDANGVDDEGASWPF
jgi:hypothetical protein